MQAQQVSGMLDNVHGLCTASEPSCLRHREADRSDDDDD